MVNSQDVYYKMASAGIFLAVIRYCYRWYKGYDDVVETLRDLSVVHLPYIYTSLNAISTHLGIGLNPPPPVILTHQAKNPSKRIREALNGHNSTSDI